MANGANQFVRTSFVQEYPDLPDILQEYINTNVRQIDIPERLKSEHNIDIKLRTVQKIMKDHNIKTVRKNKPEPMNMALAILDISTEDPLGRWGCRLVQEKLARTGVHISRDFIMDFRKEMHPKQVEHRHPATRRLHKSTIWSVGPNEEWCVDGHEKILQAMGIAIWGVNDKFSRHELGLWAVPNARLAAVPPVLYLQLVRKTGGMPLTTTADMGSELSRLIPLITTLRQIYQPFIDEDVLPAHRSVKSVYNITRERGWQPLWEKELGNIRHLYVSGKIEAGFHEADPIHRQVVLIDIEFYANTNSEIDSEISIWLWAKIVQARLDAFRLEKGTHKIRKQPNILLPSNGRSIDFYERPEQFGGTECLIKIPAKDVDMLLLEYDNDPELFLFNSIEMTKVCENLYLYIGSPVLKAAKGWNIFRQMVDAWITLNTNEQQ